MSLPEEPLFGFAIGNSIKRNREATASNQVAQNAIVQANKEAGDALEAAQHGVKVAEVLRAQLDAAISSDLDFAVAIAGVRGVARELLQELRIADPNNPLLDKKIRDRVFDEAFKVQSNLHAGQDFETRQANAGKFRDVAYGAPNSFKGGPEKKDISPNSEIREAIGMPNHITDREKFLGLIHRLGAELEKANPGASILQEKEVVDVFESHSFSETTKEDKPKNILGTF